jgi:hypothetical protein
MFGFRCAIRLMQDCSENSGNIRASHILSFVDKIFTNVGVKVGGDRQHQQNETANHSLALTWFCSLLDDI